MLFSVLSFSSLSLSVRAAEQQADADAPTQDSTQVDARMLRQASPVLGYQMLSVAGQNIDAAYIEETFGVRHGAIVLFHDQGAQFESPGVITPLRHQLADSGWSTLTVALDLPAEPKVMLSTTLQTEGANVDEQATENATNTLPPVPNRQRVEAALAFLEAKSVERVLFLGQGQGGHLAIDMLATKTFPIAGLMMIGVSELERNDVFTTLDIPILEVYGSQDLDGVEKAIKHRKALMKGELEADHSIREVMGASHDYYGLEPMLITTVRSWLNATYIQRVFP